MKLYSRRYMVFAGLGGLAVALVLGTALYLLVPGLSRSAARSPAALALSETQPMGGGAASAGRLSDTEIGPDMYSADERQTIDVYERLNEAVVNITTQEVLISWFDEPIPQDEQATGSGSIIDRRGYVLTNNHVVQNADKIYVNLADGTRYEAKVVGVDPENDLAVIKFDPPSSITLRTIAYGDSKNLKVGQKALAIGNPFGFSRTLTTGIISSLGRPVQKDSRTVIRDMIQTDASINPGNSGGPLLNARGEMIGITTMIYSPSGASAGIGFAVPVNTAKRVVPELIKSGRVSRGWIDAELVQLFPALVADMKRNNIPAPVSAGLLVSQTKRGGNADRAGIRGGNLSARYGRSSFFAGGDIIVSINDMAVANISDFYSALETTKPGDRVPIEYWRGDKRYKVEVTLSDRARAGN